MTRRLTLALLLVLLVAVGAGLYAGFGVDRDEGPAPTAGGAAATVGSASAVHEKRGSLAIPVDRSPFATLDGDSASMADYEGTVVVLNLWGTWCPPCRREIPHLVDLQREIEPRGATVIGLAVDSGSPEEIRAFLERYGVDYPVWRSGTREVVERFRAMGFPTTYIVDREGVIRERFLGPQTDEELLEALEPYLAEG